MAKITTGPLIGQVRGKTGETIFARARGGNYARALSLAAEEVGPHNLLSPTHLDTTPATPPVRGDLITAQDIPPLWKRLPKGNPGQVLSSDTNDINWTDPNPGTVTSVGLTLPAQLTVTNSPVTDSGTLTGAWNSQAKNIVFAGPTADPAAVPTFRALVAADIPNLDTAKLTSGILGSALGGTGNGFAKFTGPAGAEKSFALPNANAAILTDATPVSVPQGGTGVQACTIGKILIATGVNTANFLTPDGAHIYSDTPQTIPTNNARNLTFNLERYDNGGLHSTLTNTDRITILKAGKYVIAANVRWVANATGIRSLAILLNDTTNIAATQNPGDSICGPCQCVTTLYHLAVNDYITVSVYQESGGNLDTKILPNYSPEFSAQWLGP